jgi:glycosyltransferase involved in cell wall biosynthesis
MKPRILIYSTAYYPLVGGAEVAVKEITDRLGDQYDFDLITAKINRGFDRVERIGNITVYRLGWGMAFDKIWLAIYGSNFGLRLHKKNHYQAIWAIMASFGGFAASSFKANQKTVPYLLTLQEGDDLEVVEHKAHWVEKSFKNIFRRADYVQCISNYLSDWAKRMGVIAPIEVVPNGVNLDNYKLQISNVKLKKLEGEKIIITTSRLVKKNGIEDLIKSLSFLPEEVKLWVLGLGPEEKALKKLAVRLKLAPRVMWLGFVDNDHLFPYLREADVFVRPSLSEGLGNSFLEAMAVGLPTVGTPVGGIVDFLKPKETGWVVGVQDPKNIAQTVKFILDPTNCEEVEKITNRGKELVYAGYDWSMIAKKMGEIFEKLIIL